MARSNVRAGGATGSQIVLWALAIVFICLVGAAILAEQEMRDARYLRQGVTMPGDAAPGYDFRGHPLPEHDLPRIR